MKRNLLLLFIAYCTVSFAQQNNTDENLDKYFAGVPLRESFEKWVHHLFTHPYLGIDSFNERGVYSSFKTGIESHFPFPDSVKVKVLFLKILYYDSLTGKSTDSTNEINIEGVFSDNKSGRKTSVEVLNGLRKQLRVKYRYEDVQYFTNGTAYWFTKGKSESFPDCLLEQGHSDDLRFYFVILSYTSPSKREQMNK